MKKTVLLSMVAAAVLFTGCSEETKKAAGETATAAKETTQSAVHDVKETAQKAVDAGKKVAEEAKEKAAEAMEATKEAAAPAVEAAKEAVAETTGAAEEVDGKALYAKCASCHGADGKNPALNKSEIIAGQSAADLEMKLMEYKAGTRDVSGMGNLMQAQVSRLSDEEIKAVSAYIATF